MLSRTQPSARTRSVMPTLPECAKAGSPLALRSKKPRAPSRWLTPTTTSPRQAGRAPSQPGCSWRDRSRSCRHAARPPPAAGRRRLRSRRSASGSPPPHAVVPIGGEGQLVVAPLARRLRADRPEAERGPGPRPGLPGLGGQEARLARHRRPVRHAAESEDPVTPEATTIPGLRLHLGFGRRVDDAGLYRRRQSFDLPSRDGRCRHRGRQRCAAADCGAVRSMGEVIRFPWLD